MMYVQSIPSSKSPKIRQFYTFFVNNLKNKQLAIFVRKVKQLLNNFLGRFECCNLTIFVEFHKIAHKIIKASFELHNTSQKQSISILISLWSSILLKQLTINDKKLTIIYTLKGAIFVNLLNDLGAASKCQLFMKKRKCIWTKSKNIYNINAFYRISNEVLYITHLMFPIRTKSKDTKTLLIWEINSKSFPIKFNHVSSRWMNVVSFWHT